MPTKTTQVPVRSAPRDLVALLVGSGCQDLALRFAQLALPLVVLTETGSIAATGLVAGASGVPILVSPWWGRRARQWVCTGARLTIVALFEAAVICVVPTAAALDLLGVPVLAGAGLLLGVAETLNQPGRSALLADVGDRWRPDGAVQALTLQDLVRRVGMIVGPAAGALAVGAGMTHELLWAQAAAVAASGLLAWPVVGQVATRLEQEQGGRIRDALLGRPAVRAGWWARGASCATWFAFALGLPVLGSQQGRPEVLAGWGLSGYGVGAVVGTFAATRLLSRVSVRGLVQVAWCVSGAAWILMGAWPSPAGVLTGGALAGGFVAIGIAAVNASITRSSGGAERRTLLSGQAVVVSATSSAGMLLGGPVLALVGVRPALAVTGFVVIVVTLVATRRPQRVADCPSPPRRGLAG